MKKIFICIVIVLSIFSFASSVFASELGNNTGETNNDSTQIPSMSIEEFVLMMQARQGKVDIIKKNNREITSLKENLKSQIMEAANKVNSLRIDVSDDMSEIPDETILELKELLEFLQEAKTTLELDAEKISNEIEEILDLISTKSMQLEQYDLLIEKQNTVIVKMKEILEMVNKI